MTKREDFTGLRREVELMYTGRSRRAVLFRYGLITFDIGTIIFFIATAANPVTPTTLTIDAVLGVLILIDLGARLWITHDRVRMLRRLYTIADIVVIASLLLAPMFAENLAFLRVLRALRLLHSYHVLRDIRRESPFFRRNQELVLRSVNLLVFINFVTALVFVLQVETNPQIATYLDALYFTVTTLTTTGFGDIVLTGEFGRLLAVIIMVVGVALFLQLAQAIFRPAKANYHCRDCGLDIHDQDAAYCKRCGGHLKRR